MPKWEDIFHQISRLTIKFVNLSSSYPCAQSCLTLRPPWTVACQTPLHRIFQARMLERIATFYSRGSSQPRDQTCISCSYCIGRGIFFYHCTTWKAKYQIGIGSGTNKATIELQIPEIDLYIYEKGFPHSSVSKESAYNSGNPRSIPGLGRSAGEVIGYQLQYSWASLVAQLVKNLPAMRETWVRSLGWEDPLKKGKTTHFHVLAWKIPRTMQFIGSQRVGQH